MLETMLLELWWVFVEHGSLVAVLNSAEAHIPFTLKIYHIAVPVVSIFKLLRTGPLSHPASSTSPASSITPTTTSTAASAAQGIAQTAVAAAEMAATAATSAAGRNYEASVASGIMHIGLAVGWVLELVKIFESLVGPIFMFSNPQICTVASSLVLEKAGYQAR